jgi:hypothetical protein
MVRRTNGRGVSACGLSLILTAGVLVWPSVGRAQAYDLPAESDRTTVGSSTTATTWTDGAGPRGVRQRQRHGALYPLHLRGRDHPHLGLPCLRQGGREEGDHRKHQRGHRRRGDLHGADTAELDGRRHHRQRTERRGDLGQRDHRARPPWRSDRSSVGRRRRDVADRPGGRRLPVPHHARRRHRVGCGRGSVGRGRGLPGGLVRVPRPHGTRRRDPHVPARRGRQRWNLPELAAGFGRCHRPSPGCGQRLAAGARSCHRRGAKRP